jgi:hypothetical protein
MNKFQMFAPARLAVIALELGKSLKAQLTFVTKIYGKTVGPLPYNAGAPEC